MKMTSNSLKMTFAKLNVNVIIENMKNSTRFAVQTFVLDLNIFMQFRELMSLKLEREKREKEKLEPSS